MWAVVRGFFVRLGLLSDFSPVAPRDSGPVAPPADPYAWKPAPVKPRRPTRQGGVAVAEPDEQD
jgi:hypothetical protein